MNKKIAWDELQRIKNRAVERGTMTLGGCGFNDSIVEGIKLGIEMGFGECYREMEARGHIVIDYRPEDEAAVTP